MNLLYGKIYNVRAQYKIRGSEYRGEFRTKLILIIKQANWAH